MELPVSESASGWAWEEELRFRDFHGETRFPRVLDVLRTKGTRTYYMMPLTTAQKRLGALGVASSEADAYREDRRLRRRVAELVALAVPREPLLDLLQRHGEAGLRSAQALSREFQSA
jgi:formate hydrogenlyase transcriptional activator